MQALPHDIILFAQAEFNRLFEAYGQAQELSLEEFHTDSHHCGYLVFLEPGDNTDDLSTIGLPGGFRGNFAEFVEQRHTGVRSLYRVFFLFDNDFGLTLLFEPGLNNDAELEAWLAEEADAGTSGSSTGSSGYLLEELPF